MHSRYDGYSFPLRNTVTREKVRFHNRYGIELAGDLYLPKEAEGKLAAVAVSGPFGAVKEQCSGLYAEELASRGFAALAFDPSFTRRERRRGAERGLSRYQHRGFFRCGGLPLYPGLCGPGEGGNPGDLRLGRAWH